MSVLVRYAIALAAIAPLAHHAAHAQPANDAQREQVAANLREADAGGDGVFIRAEFPELIDLNAEHDIGRAKLIARLGRYDMAFDRADANGNGSVTPKELAASAAQAY